MSRRFLLKLSGEILAGSQCFGYDDNVIDVLTDEIIAAKKLGVGLAIVVGGGNIFRGGSWKNQSLDRVVLDQIGMLATIQNSLYLAQILQSKGQPAQVFSSFSMDAVADRYTVRAAFQALEDGKICLLGGGTSHPFFTTDTAAVLRAVELKLDLVLKGTKVDGLYDADPAKNPDAKLIRDATFDQCLEQKLGVMDMTAFSLASDNGMPIKIFNISKPGGLEQAITNAESGTLIHP